MAEQTFKSPGFFEQEIELTAERQRPQGVPAGIIGAAKMGPAFIPLTVGTFTDFENRFGSLTPEKFAPYAVKEWLENRQSVTFLRVLGAGANSTGTHFANTRAYGFVHNAGFQVQPSALNEEMGSVQFLSAAHTISAESDVGFPLYADSGLSNLRETSGNTIENDDINLVRAMILNTSGSYFQASSDGSTTSWHESTLHVTQSDTDSNIFYLKLVLDGYSSAGDIDLSWGNDHATTGKYGAAAPTAVPNRVYKCSFDPDSQFYVGKVLNTDPKKFQSEGHVLWLDLGVENELAAVKTGGAHGFLARGLGIESDQAGIDSSYASAQDNGVQWNALYGQFNARYRAPQTTKFISQPFGKTEYNLFHFETISDGAVANNEYKVSISNLRRSIDPNYKYGTFTVEIRKFDDSDQVPQIIERYVDCNLDPTSENFVAKKIGDKKAVFNFDAPNDAERRLVVSGRYANRSLHCRIVMDRKVYDRQIPQESLPFGFRGIPVLDVNGRIGNSAGNSSAQTTTFPALPHTYKITRGEVLKSDAATYVFSGQAGTKERTDSRIYWGVKMNRIEDDATISGGIYQSNISSLHSLITKAYTKFMGISGNNFASGVFNSDADTFMNNKFTLAQVVLGKGSADLAGKTSEILKAAGNKSLADLGSASNEMKNSVYIRNGVWDLTTYEIADPYETDMTRFSLATLIHDPSPTYFNKFSKYMKFTNVFYGGFDGLNILDEDIEDLNDKASAIDGGKSADTYTGGLGLKGTDDGEMSGKGLDNNIINSYRQGIKIMTDDTAVKHNLLAIPGIREPKITDYAASSVRDYQMAMYVMDIPAYDEDGNRLFDQGRPDVEASSDNFENRVIDNNFCATYFPDVFIDDSVNNRAVKVPSSVAALGAIGYNDSKAYPWFAPAGFNRGALGFVSNVATRLSVADRDELYEKRINPIANFPDGGFVIFGQKTMQIQPSALDRVNVRRMLLEVKRQVAAVANLILFEQHTPATRKRFEALVSPRLALIQAQAGIEQFRVICNETNNSQKDIDENRMNGRILLVPTRAVEFIAIDFIVDSSGVSFV